MQEALHRGRRQQLSAQPVHQAPAVQSAQGREEGVITAEVPALGQLTNVASTDASNTESAASIKSLLRLLKNNLFLEKRN